MQLRSVRARSHARLRGGGYAEARVQGLPLARPGEQGVQRDGVERARCRFFER